MEEIHLDCDACTLAGPRRNDDERKRRVLDGWRRTLALDALVAVWRIKRLAVGVDISGDVADRLTQATAILDVLFRMDVAALLIGGCWVVREEGCCADESSNGRALSIRGESSTKALLPHGGCQDYQRHSQLA